jgi:hypothetical protein
MEFYGAKIFSSLLLQYSVFENRMKLKCDIYSVAFSYALVC